MKIFLLFLLVGASNAIHITCNFRGNNWVVIGNTYECDVTAMNFTDNSTHVTSYSGQHLAGKSSADVDVIWFSSSCCPSFNLTTLPKGFLNIFPNFIAFAFRGCSINFFNGDELQEYQNLKVWSLLYSNLTRVPGNFFASTPNMRFIHFSNNKIEAVGFGLLDDLPTLEQAWFQGNICINKDARNPSQLPALIEALRQNCPDIEPETTTTSTTTTNQPPKCEIDDLEDFVCGLEEEVEVLQGEVKNLKNSNENLQTRTETLETENEEIRAHLEELERIVLELTSRPCAC